MKERIGIVLLMIIASLCLYQLNIKAAGKEEGYKITDIRIYKNTPAWELALAVRRQHTGKIKRIAQKEPQLINYQEPKYGVTLLLWSVAKGKYRSAEALLKCGADPEIASGDKSTYGGDTPLLVAAGYGWVARFGQQNPKYVKLLLRYGADPNKPYTGFNIPHTNSVTEPGTSPLMQSIGCGIEKTKALVEAGADINYKTPLGTTAAITALVAGGNRTLEYLQYAHYLIVEKKAKVTGPYYRRESFFDEDPNEKFYPVNLLRSWVYPLDSKAHQLKMEIVEEFARQGVNYWETKINKFTLDYIKRLYPDSWEEYIRRY